MTTIDQDQALPEARRDEKIPTYQRRLRANFSGQLDTATEAALVWSGLVEGLEETDDPDEKRLFEDQLKIFKSWNSHEGDFWGHLEDLRKLSQRDVDVYNPGSTQAKFAQRQLKALKEMTDSTNALEDALSVLSNGLDAKSARIARANRVNSWIGSHNEVVDRVAGVAQDNHGAETPITGEGNIPEKEKIIGVLDSIVGAAKGHTYIHTDTRPIPVRHGHELRETDRTGFQTFGDAADVLNLRGGDFLCDRETTEAVLFQPNMIMTYKTETYVVEAGLFSKQQTRERQAASSMVPDMVENSLTGEKEPGIRVAYQFYANGSHYDSAVLPSYQTSSGRSGNILIVETVVPQSIAKDFEQAVRDNPRVARAFAEMIMFNNGVTDGAWKGGEAPMRPPYDELPNNWKLSIIHKIDAVRVESHEEVVF